MFVPEMTPCIGEFMYCFGDSHTTTDLDEMLIYLSEIDELENNIGVQIDIYNAHRLSFKRALVRHDVAGNLTDGIFELIGEEAYDAINYNGLCDDDKINDRLAKVLDTHFENEKFAYGTTTGHIIVTKEMLSDLYED